MYASKLFFKYFDNFSSALICVARKFYFVLGLRQRKLITAFQGWGSSKFAQTVTRVTTT